jgi:hypothetical protein
MQSFKQSAVLKVELVGQGTFTLHSRDHMSTGGEGSIYRVGKNMVAKIYTDPKKMAQLGLSDKIELLAKLKSPYIVAPAGLILSEKRKPIGYYMAYAEGHPLSRVFTNEFWNKEHFSHRHAQELVHRMRDTVSFAHSNGAILVDANELNWLVSFSRSNPEPRIVDVDSWSLGRWPATVIMPSIRDWHAKSFDEKSDWFSWGVVTFQIFTGLHPYKGTHTSYKRNEFIERMKANASVFSPGVRLNQAVRDFSLIPAPLLDWYEAVFERGERTVPPSPLDKSNKTPKSALVMRAKITNRTGLLVFEKIFEKVGDPALRVFDSGAVLLSSGSLVDARMKREIAGNVSQECQVARTTDGWLILELRGGKVCIRHISMDDGKEQELAFIGEAVGILEQENHFYSLGERGLTEVKIHSFGNKILASAGLTWSVMHNATELFKGFGVQNAMGATFFALPTGEQGILQVRVRELDRLKVVTGKAGYRSLILVAVDKMGVYKRFEFFFTKDYSTYKVNESAVDQSELNLAILPKGVNASIIDDGELIISVPSTGAVTKVEDKHLSTKMTLGNFGDQVVYIENGVVWSVRMK